MNLAKLNGALAFGALLPPLMAEYATAKPGNVPGTGFDILLYEPFDFAYALLVTALFVGANLWASIKKEDGSKIHGVLLGILMAIGWFVVSFLAVGQVHISLGGKL